MQPGRYCCEVREKKTAAAEKAAEESDEDEEEEEEAGVEAENTPTDLTGKPASSSTPSGHKNAKPGKTDKTGKTGETGQTDKTSKHLLSYGWDKFMRLGWRAPTDNIKAKVWAKPNTSFDGLQDTDPVEIHFDDGESRKLSDIIVGQAKGCISKMQAPQAIPPWTGEMVQTHHKLTLSQRAVVDDHGSVFEIKNSKNRK